MARSRRWTLEIIWSQPEAKSPDYIEQLDSFFETAPSILQLYRIHLSFGQQKMQGFLDACIARQTANSLNLKEQERLLEGLLVAHHYLTDHEQIPDLCFSLQMASNDGKGVIIRGDALMSGQKRLWYFIAALLIELEQVPEYKFEKQQLTILSGSGTMTLPKPEFSLVGNGFMIKNWSLEQLNAFFEATDFTERWYKHPQDERELYLVRRERLAGNRARVNETGQDGNQKLLPPGVILSLINSGKSLKPAVWSSLEHYANNGQLTARLCRALAPVIENQAVIVPDTVKNTVTAMLAELDTEEAILIQPTPVINELTFKAAMDALNRFEVLEETELEMLQPYRDQMTLNQLDSVIHKMGHSVDLETQLDWHITYEDKSEVRLDSMN
ncbi:hypothetical protein [Endozoicomonas sp. ISHI1]|uniref:hypothetical protein n=3 Tax=Endozoicomonas TaxID=305899 RepID=UPI00214930F3|nr:hypothetical protein [Endozoicomonas sp. ISHI1]